MPAGKIRESKPDSVTIRCMAPVMCSLASSAAHPVLAGEELARLLAGQARPLQELLAAHTHGDGLRLRGGGRQAGRGGRPPGQGHRTSGRPTQLREGQRLWARPCLLQLVERRVSREDHAQLRALDQVAHDNLHWCEVCGSAGVESGGGCAICSRGLGGQEQDPCSRGISRLLAILHVSCRNRPSATHCLHPRKSTSCQRVYYPVGPPPPPPRSAAHHLRPRFKGEGSPCAGTHTL